MLTSSEISFLIQQAKKHLAEDFHHKDLLKFALSCVDLTTLEGSDNENKIKQLCDKAQTLTPQIAAVCVYPVFIKNALFELKNHQINVASVAGAFPSGQSPLSIRLAEVEYALNQGADEIDMVISRGKFLSQQYKEVFLEVEKTKQICKSKTLKVILETGELQSIENIYNASMIAMQAGADFIKTSTGKIAINATPEAFIVMATAIKDFYQQSGKMVGIKVAGGLSQVNDVLLYVQLLNDMLGEKWKNKSCFRIGTSRLADKLQNIIENKA